MKLQFAADLPHQRSAIDAVVELFEGQPLADSTFSVSFQPSDSLFSDSGVGNRLVLGNEALLANLQRVQERNDIRMATGLPDGRYHFAVEMETGTGKTYVYLRTAFELNKRYGFQKFVIVVPSIAIREGVLHSIETMRDHFHAIYSTPFDSFVYDSKKLGNLRAFATASSMQIMVINIQAFNRDTKDDSAQLVMYQERDSTYGKRPIDFLRACAPVVIVDEPQKMEGEASAAAIERLDPLCTLRYSATYESPNKVYRLGPIEALDQSLVKRIEVASVREEDNLNHAYVRLVKVDGKKGGAQVEINVGSGANAAHKKVTVKANDDLYVKSGERQEYRSHFIVRSITFEAGNEHVELSGGQRVDLGKALGSLDDEVMREQVRQTVIEHLEKERRLRGKGIKVLSLLFIDRVDNYRVYGEDRTTWSLGKIGRWLEEALREQLAKPGYKGLIEHPIEKLHDGYFSIDKKGAYRDTSGETKDDDDTYEKIMRGKEQLLSLDEPLRFIVSHSALREGWDNPNVFQICTLNETRSATRKRQELGRGLRLAVNQKGERVHDEQVNRLTVIANESYKSFASSLQKEYEEENVRFGQVPDHAFAKLVVERDGESVLVGQADSGALWEHFKRQGYLDADGRILDRFDPKNPAFVLDVPAGYEALRPGLVDAIANYTLETRVVNARDRRTVKPRKQVLLDPEFQELWARIAQRTRYRVEFATDTLVDAAVVRMKAAPPIHAVKIEIDKRAVEVTRAGVAAEDQLRYAAVDARPVERVPDVLAYLQNETELTRHTLVRILVESGRAEELRVNPQSFVTMAVREITEALHDLMLDGIRYEKTGSTWDMKLLGVDESIELVRYLDRLYKVQNQDKTPFDAVEFDSEVERQFAKDLDDNDQVKLFVKLPKSFQVDTPLGPYSPDWAIVFEDDAKVYLVRETKSTSRELELRPDERKKIDCGRRHFDAIGVNYDITTSLADTIKRLQVRTPQSPGS